MDAGANAASWDNLVVHLKTHPNSSASKYDQSVKIILNHFAWLISRLIGVLRTNADGLQAW